jgi:DegV family protein with EDD domain
MSPSVAVVTDSTAYLPPTPGVIVVPLQVVLGGSSYDDVPQLPAAFSGLVTTSRPSPERFAGAYVAAAASGATGVVSIHLSGELSGTAEAAALAAASSPVPVEVIDSRSIAMGLGFPVLAAARAAGQGGSLSEVGAAARRCMDDTRTFFYVDTLEYLRRGGRIGAAAMFLGSALAVKPLLHLVDGRIVPLEKVRTSGRALGRLEELVVGAAGEEAVEVAVQHLGASERAGELGRRLGERVAKAVRVTVVEVGAVIGAHTGPGMIGVTVVLAESSGFSTGP